MRTFPHRSLPGGVGVPERLERAVWHHCGCWIPALGVPEDPGRQQLSPQVWADTHHNLCLAGTRIWVAQHSRLPVQGSATNAQLCRAPGSLAPATQACSSKCLSNSSKLTAHTCFPRAMGDIVEEMDSHRRKSFALLTRKGADGRAEGDYSEQPPLSRASRSFSRVRALFYLPQVHEESTVMTMFVPYVHDKFHRWRKRPVPPGCKRYPGLIWHWAECPPMIIQ